MRRPLVALTVLSCLGLAACEDGPNQTFTPAGPNASQSNDGQTPGSVDPTQQGFGTQGGGNNAMEICTGPQKAKRWADMVKEPIKPPTQGGGLDISGGSSWEGLTIEQAEAINCQSQNAGDEFGDGSQVNYWGDNGEVWVDYTVSTHKIGFMTFWPGYVGSLDMTSRNGSDTFKIYVNQQSTKNGVPYTLDWKFPADAKFAGEVNELYDALTATYAPGLPADPACTNSGACITGKFGDIAYIYWPALGTGLWVPTWTAPQPAPSILNRIDVYLAKTLPFSLAFPYLKLDVEGPVGLAGNLGNLTTPCNMRMNSAADPFTYKDFTSTCVNVTGDAAKDQIEENKLLGGIRHGTESWSFDVSGVDINFKDIELPANDILKDKDRPSDDDPAINWDCDQSTLGKILNDRIGNKTTGGRDNHGAGLVYLEYARLVQDGLNKATLAANPGAPTFQLGAKQCTTDVLTSGDFADGCTGMEGFLSAWNGPPNGGASTGDPGLDKLAVGYPNVALINSGMGLGLKPGHPSSVFCLDATGDFAHDYNVCPWQGDIFSTSFDRVTQVLGKGHVYNLPVEAQDVRFFWKAYFEAIVKYMKVAGNATLPTPADVHAVVLDVDSFFFDSIGAGQFEIGEYVDRTTASKTQPPTDINITADVKNGIFNDYSFSRHLLRGETAVYTAVLEDQAHGLGQEHSAHLTNVFGSPVLANGWSATANNTAYACATGGWTAASPAIDPAVVKDCGGQPIPLDDNGAPRLLRYPGAFSGAVTALTLGATPIKVTQTFDNIQAAMINIPLTQNPYDPTSTQLPPLTILVPWTPKQPGIGFHVPINGTLEKFIQCSELDFSGTTISANVNYDAVIDPKTMQPMTDGTIEFKAVETTDFLGEVFLCQDPASGDLLGARMYTPVAGILDWLDNHPGSKDACGVIIRYSPYGNFADYITSLTNGVRLSITQGGGFGRVVDVVLFVPGQ